MDTCAIWTSVAAQARGLSVPPAAGLQHMSSAGAAQLYRWQRGLQLHWKEQQLGAHTPACTVTLQEGMHGPPPCLHRSTQILSHPQAWCGWCLL